jgi:hypothetical protein
MKYERHASGLTDALKQAWRYYGYHSTTVETRNGLWLEQMWA